MQRKTQKPTTRFERSDRAQVRLLHLALVSTMTLSHSLTSAASGAAPAERSAAARSAADRSGAVRRGTERSGASGESE